MPSSSQRSRRRWSRSWRRKAPCRLVLARRVAVAAWRLARADRMEVELFEERRWEDAGVGMALIRDGNGTRSFETLMRYRGAAMAEFWRALKTLKALQAEPADVLEQAAGADLAPEMPAPHSPRRRRCARSRPDRQRAARTPIAADRTNPSPSWHTCCPNRRSPAPPCTSRRHPRRVPRTERTRDRLRSADIMTAQPAPGRHPA